MRVVVKRRRLWKRVAAHPRNGSLSFCVTTYDIRRSFLVTQKPELSEVED